MAVLSILLSLCASSAVLASPIVNRQNSLDVTVLKFAAVAEALESQFYTQGLAKFKPEDFASAGFMSGQATHDQLSWVGDNYARDVTHGIRTLSIIKEDEITHLNALRAVIPTFGGSTADIDGCQFNFDAALKDVPTMLATARVLENVGVSAYIGGAALLSDKSVLLTAATILSVEARHSSTINLFSAGSTVPSPFDIGLSPSQVLALAAGFVSGGCDPVAALGIPDLANAALKVTNSGTISPGTLLTFGGSGIDNGDKSALFCNMIVGGSTVAFNFPISECVVPEIDGPVYLYVTNTSIPLTNNVENQFVTSLIAGPALAFIDTIPNTASQLLVQKPGSQAIVQGPPPTLVDLGAVSPVVNATVS